MNDGLNVELSAEYNYMTLNWSTCGNTVSVLFYGAEGQAIPAGTHHIVFIEFEDQLERSANQNIDYISGQYADNARNLFPIVLSGQDQQDNFLPKRFALYPPYPNPFNPVTTIKFDLPVDSFINISVFDLSGRLVDVLVSDIYNAGSYEMDWNADTYSTGLYLIQFKSDKFTATKKIILMK